MYNVITLSQIENLQQLAAGSTVTMLPVEYLPGYAVLSFEYTTEQVHVEPKIIDLFTKVGVEIDTDTMLHGAVARRSDRHPGIYKALKRTGHFVHTFKLTLIHEDVKFNANSQQVLSFLCPACHNEDAKLVHCAIVRCSLDLDSELLLDVDTSMSSYIGYEDSSLAKSIMLNKPWVDETDLYEAAGREPERFECSHCGADWPDLRSIRQAGGFILKTFTNITHEHQD